MKCSRTEIAAATARVVLGGVLFYSGFQKLDEPFAFQQALSNYDLLPIWAEFPLALLISWLEVVSGVCLISGVFVTLAASIAVGLTLGFGFFVSSALVRGLDVECGCFGGATTVSGLHLALDVFLLALSFATVKYGAGRWSLEAEPPFKQRSTRVSVAVLLAVASVAFYCHHRENLPRDLGAEAASLMFEPVVLEFGPLEPGEKTEHTVVYKNVGSDPLEIVWVQSSCRCTVPQPDKMKLKPGETGRLNVRYEARPGRGPQQTVKVYQRGKSMPAVLEVTAVDQPDLKG